MYQYVFAYGASSAALFVPIALCDIIQQDSHPLQALTNPIKLFIAKETRVAPIVIFLIMLIVPADCSTILIKLLIIFNLLLVFFPEPTLTPQLHILRDDLI